MRDNESLIIIGDESELQQLHNDDKMRDEGKDAKRQLAVSGT